MSDLHMEGKNYKQFVHDVLPDGKDVDALILAGDITTMKFPSEALECLQLLCSKHKKVFYVPGNHEYYGSSPTQAEVTLDWIHGHITNLEILRPGLVVEYNGRRILGCTLWFKDDPFNFINEQFLNDFYLIKDFKPWVYEENKKSIEFLEKSILPGDIVITHHMPHPLSVATRFRGDTEVNRFFLCDVSDTIHKNKPAIWLHGHTHDPFDYKVGDTRVYCNPMGYSREKSNPDFKTRFLVEV